MVAIFPAANKGPGVSMAFPNVCKVPAPPSPSPVPAPFPSIGNMSMASGTSTKVKFDGQEAFTLSSKLPSTNGDEAGVAKGVVSQTTMDQAVPKAGCMMVMVEGSPVVRLTSPMAHNGANANMPGGLHAVPCQAKVLVAP